VQIIPVIDVLGGKVVAAVAGNRQFYQPIKSCLTHEVDPIRVISALLELHSFKAVYLADLDAIQTADFTHSLYKRLCDEFPETRFWFDIGIKQQDDLKVLPSNENAIPVLGTETLLDDAILEQNDCVLSLDFQNGKALGVSDLIEHADVWPQHVIAMNLDRVGVNLGPDYELIKYLQAQQQQSVIYAAGGVRNQEDLILLQSMGAGGALVASALHNGTINKSALAQF